MKRDSTAVAVLFAAVFAGAASAQLRTFTVDDEMKLRSIVDVKISPDGKRVAYVVSTPSLAKNEHEAALYVVPSDGGGSVRLGETLIYRKTPTR